MLHRTVARRYFWNQDLTRLFAEVPRGHYVRGRFVRLPPVSAGLHLIQERVLLASSPADEANLLALASMAEPVDSLLSDAAEAAASAAATWRDTPSDRREAVLRDVRAALSWRASQLSSAVAVNAGLPLNTVKSDFVDWSTVPLPPAAVAAAGPAHATVVGDPFEGPRLTWQAIEGHLGAGRGVVWTPPAVAPLFAQVVAQCVHETASVPPGLVNIVHGLASDEGAAAAAVKPSVVGIVTLGTSMDAVAARVLTGLCRSAGQHHDTVRVIFVHREHWRPLIQALGAAFSSVRLGHPLDPLTQMGPMLTGVAMDRCLATVREVTVSKGGRVVIGGYRATFPRGYFVPPTIITGLPAHEDAVSTNWTGPVVCVQRYEDLQRDVVPVLRASVVVSDTPKVADGVPTVSW